jgi:AcrR family transcriptional regulator
MRSMFALATRTRSTAGARRLDLIAAASSEFAITGLHGTSTESIARRAGISQPYLFRLFGTKKLLFIACAQACFERVLATFAEGVEGDTPQERLAAMGVAYMEMLSDREILLAQMQLYAACSDPDICQVAREGFLRLRDAVRELSGASGEEVHWLFAKGMLVNVVASIDLPELGDPEAW